ncbi:hypothetical protein B7R25_06435 [Subtercola boreus]|uniref:Uncharacterized protein n=1 Tax=Subtercola boreus TaxID=120213 RepID=A0A3E0WD63_9MICO|nr:hypothetical protein [Subtercola boreus]RFA21028.1 hypothetical protein B7R24_06365 [Subtercola boreus]RFA21412.1 hypothetical protein B7R23_06310 [Subtercola boreus]RFA27383.1 hypothetical protein B7R25_06435 [Subtercola boreus]
MYEQRNPGIRISAASRELRERLESTRDGSSSEWRIIGLPAPEMREILARGGGSHRITQQQPARHVR